MAGVQGDGWKYFPDYYRDDPMLCSSGCGMPRPRAEACSWCQRRQVPPGVTLLAEGANALQQCKWTWDHSQISRIIDCRSMQPHGRSNDMAGVHGDGWKYFPDYYRGDPMLCSSGCGMPRPRAGACSWCQRRQVPPGVTLLAKGANALQQCKWTWDHGQISRAKQAMGK